jgi:hypothetical protein
MMAVFCVQCGTPIAKDAQFCTSCGAKSDSKNSLGQESRQSVPLMNATERGTVTQKSRNKTVFAAVLCGVLVLGGLAVGGALYVATNKASQLKEEHGLDSFAREATRVAKGSIDTTLHKSSTAQRNACSLISKEEVASATGTSFSGTTLSEDRDACTYDPGGDSAVSVVVDVKWRDGNLAMQALPTMSEQLGQENIRHPVQGIGDEAYLLGVDEETQQGMDKASEAVKGLSSFATGPLVFRKGEAWVAVTATLAENKADVQKKIARIVAGRI